MPRPPDGTLVIVSERTQNKKVGDVATTYAAQTSCPDDCVFFDGGGCYAENGPMGAFVTRPLNKAARAIEHTPEDVAREEARKIDAIRVAVGRPMRLHTVGDCKTNEAARIVSEAARRYRERGGGPVWTYTHAWRVVDRESWGEVSVLASCETPMDVLLAHSRGYAACIVVDEFFHDKRYTIGASGLDGVYSQDVIPCPEMTRGVKCSDCRLCFNDGRLRIEGLTIAFAAHGSQTKRVKASLEARA